MKRNGFLLYLQLVDLIDSSQYRPSLPGCRHLLVDVAAAGFVVVSAGQYSGRPHL